MNSCVYHTEYKLKSTPLLKPFEQHKGAKVWSVKEVFDQMVLIKTLVVRIIYLSELMYTLFGDVSDFARLYDNWC